MTTPVGEAMLGQMAVFNQLERQLIGQRTREALAERRAAGVRLGWPSVLLIDVVRRIVEARAAGQSYPLIAVALEADGVSTRVAGRGGSPRQSEPSSTARTRRACELDDGRA